MFINWFFFVENYLIILFMNKLISNTIKYNIIDHRFILDHSQFKVLSTKFYFKKSSKLFIFLMNFI